jgi:hypothetical protein
LPQRTDLASGVVNNSDRLTVELLEQSGKPPIIAITWPAQATVTTPTNFDAVVATTMRILANAVIKLAALRVHKRL